MTTKISGKVTRVIFSKDGFFICMVNDTCVSVNHPKIKVGFDGDFTGSWVDHPKFGKQFKAAFAIEKLPETKEGFKHYLMSGAFKGIGGVTADKIIAYLGDNPLEVMNTNLDEILNVPKVKKEILQSIKDTWLDNTVRAEITIFLQQFDISSININKIYESMGVSCIATIMSNPYIIIEKVTGIGFKTADRIALKVGIEPNSELRISECIKYVLVESGNYGNCYLLKDQIIKKVKELINQQDEDAIVNCINSSDGIMKITINEEDRYYSIQLYYAEQSVMGNLSNMLDRPNRAYLDNMANEETLSSEQRDAVYGALSNNISILTGGPGCGKCLKKGTLVLMFNGTKKAVEDIKIGDLLMGDDNTHRTVLSLAHGYETMYDILSKDNKSWGCNESHILSLKYNDKRPCVINGVKYYNGDIVDIEVKDYLLLSNRKKHHLKQYSIGVEYIQQNVLIPSYLLGLWLGDGSKSSSNITNIDSEVYIYAESIVNELNLKFKKTTPINKAPFLSLIGERGKSFRTLLNKYGLYNNKHIPNEYLINSRENRLNLLAGLIDSDGYYINGVFEITQKSKNLAYDIYDLSLSLGFRVSIKEKKATLKREGVNTYESLVYRICISGNCDQIPTLIKRKKGVCKPNKNHLHSGFQLINKGIGEYYGFELDGNKRFVLGNYVVTHNTYTTKTIVDSLIANKKKIGICAPTGKAALRSSTVIGHDAMTIHRLLGFNPRYIGSFEYNANKPLDYDYIIVEESSMIDIKLMSHLLEAVDYHTQILFVGDHNQLPPVGAGAPFKDMIESGLIPTFKLNKIFRQGMNSKIVTYAHDINNGEYPNIQSPLKDPSLWNTDVDCLFIDSGCYDARKASDYGKESSLAYGYDINKMIIKLYTEIIKKYKGFEDIQLLIPKRVGDVGTNSINKLIQDVVNPIIDEASCIEIGEKQFRLNDKVIHVQNNYELGDKGIFNGEIGKIIGIDVKKQTCVVEFEDKTVPYERGDMGDLELAFAITTHKCVSEDQKIFTKELGWIEIKDAYPGLSVQTGNGGFKKILSKTNVGLKPEYKIKTNCGYELKASAEHPIQLLSGLNHEFVKVKDIKIGNHACITRENIIDNVDSFDYDISEIVEKSYLKLNIPTKLTKDLCWFMGILVGDGWYSNNIKGDGYTCVSFNINETKSIEKFFTICNTFGLNPNKININSKNSTSINFCGKYFREYMRLIGMDNYTSSDQKKVPNSIMRTTFENKSAFIKGYFDADGSVSPSGNGNTRIIATSISSLLLKDIQLLLTQFGIITKFKKVNDKKTYISKGTVIKASEYFLLALVSPKSFIRFKEFIDFTNSDKYNNLNSLLLKSNYKTNIDIIPNNEIFIKKLKEICCINNIKVRTRTVLGNFILGKRKTLNYYDLNRFICLLTEKSIPIPDFLSEIINKNYFYDQIVSIECGVERNMYDIEVEKHHSFQCQGFVVHNSQGSEFDCVILPIMTEYGIMLEKSLIYTALTRAKKLAVFIGQRHALMKAVKTINKAKRQTSLSELLIFEKNLVE